VAREAGHRWDGSLVQNERKWPPLSHVSMREGSSGEEALVFYCLVQPYGMTVATVVTCSHMILWIDIVVDTDTNHSCLPFATSVCA
jgi:hypothetical protein